MSKNLVDLSVTLRGDVTESNLADYLAAFSESVKGDRKVSYGRTVVYMAARDIRGAEFVALDFAGEVNVSPAYVSTLAGLALAVDRGITPHGTEVMGKRWAALVQNMTKAVRAELRSKAFTLKGLDSILFATADKKKADRKETDKRVKNATDPKSGDKADAPVVTVESAITALDQAASFLALSKVTPAQAEQIEAIVAILMAAHATSV